MPILDSMTIHICSTLASLTFGLLFVALWMLRERGRFYLLCGAAALTYSATLAGFCLSSRNVAVVTLISVGIGAYNSYMLAALREFEGRHPVSPMVIALPLWSGLSYGGFAILPDGIPTARVANSVVLGVSTLVVGWYFLRTTGSRAPRSQRIVGVIQFAYTLSYVASIALEFVGGSGYDWLSLVPMMSDQVLLGVLNIALLSMPGERAEADLRELALRDPLTGVWNRAGLEHVRRRGGDRATDIILFDVDKFKHINDREGHAAGDDVLRMLAAKIRAALPGDADLIRLGGDEFAALIPSGGDGARAGRIAETLRQVAREGTRCTISIGIAHMPVSGDTMKDAFARADAMLYRAKAAGRDRVAA